MEGRFFQITKSVLRVFVEAARHYEAVPSDDARVPKFPAMVGERVFHLPRAVGALAVAGILVERWDERVSVVIIIHLRGFQLHFVHADFFCQPINFWDLVFIGLYHEKLKNDVRAATFQIFFPFYHVSGALQHIVQRAADSILLVSFLCRAIHRNDESVEAAFHCAAGVFVVEEMAVGARDGENFSAMRVVHHVEEFGVDVRFALKIKDEIKQVAVEFFDGFSEKIFFQIACVAAEGSQPAGAFGAAQVASSRRFYADGDGHSPLDRAAEYFCQIKGRQHFSEIPSAARGEFRDEVQAVVPKNVHA